MPSEAEATFRSFDSVPKAVSQAISQAASQKEIRYFPVTLYDYDPVSYTHLEAKKIMEKRSQERDHARDAAAKASRCV